VADRHPDHDLPAELEPAAEQLLDRHLAMAKDWLPHECIPWSLGRDFDVEPWTQAQSQSRRLKSRYRPPDSTTSSRVEVTTPEGRPNPG
jgi:hypothetical protein